MGILGEDYKHPSYGMLQFSRVSSGRGQPFFGSSIRADNFITLTITKAKFIRDLHRDLHFGTEHILKARMSTNQFAEAITSLNYGSGIPITLEWLAGEGTIEDPPLLTNRDRIEDEFKASMRELTKSIDELVGQIKELMGQKNLKKDDHEKVINLAAKLSSRVGNTIPFYS